MAQRTLTIRDSLKLLGCGVFGCIVIACVVVLLASQPIARFVVAGLGATALVGVLVKAWEDARAVQAFRREYAPRGKDLLLVYSSSRHWQEYIENNWLPMWGSRAVVVNRSDPNWKRTTGARLWRRVAGSKEHTPIAIIVPAKGKIEVVRFFFAFRDHKHGKLTTLHQRERELAAALQRSAEQ